jgi:hypothetical protein
MSPLESKPDSVDYITEEDAKKLLAYIDTLIDEDKYKKGTTVFIKILAYLDANFNIEEDKWANCIYYMLLRGGCLPAVVTGSIRTFVEDSVNANKKLDVLPDYFLKYFGDVDEKKNTNKEK